MSTDPLAGYQKRLAEASARLEKLAERRGYGHCFEREVTLHFPDEWRFDDEDEDEFVDYKGPAIIIPHGHEDGSDEVEEMGECLDNFYDTFFTHVSHLWDRKRNSGRFIVYLANPPQPNEKEKTEIRRQLLEKITNCDLLTLVLQEAKTISPKKTASEDDEDDSVWVSPKTTKNDIHRFNMALMELENRLRLVNFL